MNKLGIEENYINIIEVIYDKPTADNILNNEMLKVFPLKSRTGQVCPVTSPVQHSIRNSSQIN